MSDNIIQKKGKEMDDKAINLAKEYLVKRMMEEEKGITYRVFIVWKAKALQNYKYLIGNSLNSTYIELTYNGDKNEWYLDAYKKVENVVIPN